MEGHNTLSSYSIVQLPHLSTPAILFIIIMCPNGIVKSIAGTPKPSNELYNSVNSMLS
jgi:hypothetical protein